MNNKNIKSLWTKYNMSNNKISKKMIKMIQKKKKKMKII